MRIFHVILMTLALLAGVSGAQAQGAFGGGAPHISAHLVAESATPAPGKTTNIAFAMVPEAGWHGYWENPGDAGLGMMVSWVCLNHLIMMFKFLDLSAGCTINKKSNLIVAALLI